jgi:hypothetical protein
MTDAQQSMWHPRRAPEELYDLEKDPFETNNLAGDPEYWEILLEMRTRLEEWMIDTHDTGLMPEVYMKENSQNRTAYHLAQDTVKYPIERILELNQILLEDQVDQEALAGFLDDPHELLRYWSAVWLQYGREPEDPVVSQLNKALADSSPYVRLAVADALCSYDLCSETAQQVILDGLNSDEQMVLLMAARIFELNRENAIGIEKQVMEIKENLDKSTEGKWKGYDLYANWALREAFREE